MTTSQVLELPLVERATQAFRAAVEKVIAENERLGLPVYVQRDGQVVAITPEEARSLLKGDA